MTNQQTTNEIERLIDLNDLFEIGMDVKRLRGELEVCRMDIKVYQRNIQKGNPGSWNERLHQAYAREDELDEEARKARAELREAKSETKAPGFGEWKPVTHEKALAGAWNYYQHPLHPEWGTLGVYRFSGWSMQRVSARTVISLNGKEAFDWSGSNARTNAAVFLSRVFGL